MRYRLILAGEAHHEVSLLARVLGVSRAGYYGWKNRGESRRQREDAALAEKIRAIHAGSRCTYGSPRVHAELRQGHGVRCSRKRVARLVREHGLVGVHRRRRCLTKQDTQAAPAPDLTGRAFTAERPGEKLVGDITYLPTEEEAVPGRRARPGHPQGGRVLDGRAHACRTGLRRDPRRRRPRRARRAGDLPLRSRHPVHLRAVPRRLRAVERAAIDWAGPGRASTTRSPSRSGLR